MENHKVTIENREMTTITDIVEIDSFDEEEIRATLKKGALVIRGTNMNIQKLDLQTGEAVIGGTINSLMYVKVKEKGEKSLLAKIMK
ncbi:MAG: sporulation protein YabP [Firmicutes bacterium]|nr:sporulation protein YabP [Bacillota bacterium]MBR2619629.1 sporulation protein YabP [Bacillota bacterium]